MLCELIKYSTLLFLPDISAPTIERIQIAARDVLGSVWITPTMLEFDYSGRDTGRKVVRFLSWLAEEIGDADGEVECHLVNSDGPDEWEFYTLRGGRLYRQRATLLREAVEEVRLEREGAAVGTVEITSHDR